MLPLLLAVSLFLRMGEARRGLPCPHDWGEPATAGVALETMKTGDFNPQGLNYGSLPTYVLLVWRRRACSTCRVSRTSMVWGISRSSRALTS